MTTDTPSSRDEEIPTPRTDAECFKIGPSDSYLEVVYSDLSRQLERDLLRLSAEREKDIDTAIQVGEILGLTDKDERSIIHAAKDIKAENDALRLLCDKLSATQTSIALFKAEATLAERDKELAEARKALECEISERSHLQGELLECNKSTSAEIQELRAQLLAAQTELASIPARVESDEIVCDRCGESCGRVNLPVPRTSTSTDPTLLDEVNEKYDELREFVRHACLQIQKHRSLTDTEMDQLFQYSYRMYTKHDVESRLRQSTRETEEKV